MSDYSLLEFLKLGAYWASYLYFPAAVLLLFRLTKARGRPIVAFALALLSVLAYARFVEPRILLTRRHEITLDRCFGEAGAIRLAVFSDMHIGIFANAMPLRRIAAAADAVDPDAVLIAGDFVYFLKREKFEVAFRALAGIEAPVFAVLGNHDVGFPGPDVGAPLKDSLGRLGVVDVENRSQKVVLAESRRPVEIAGLSDAWQRRQDMRAVASPSALPRILLTHNPLTAFDVPAGADVDLLVAGHTHGGQIYVPFFTCKFLSAACRPFREGLGQANGRQVFITSGTGMVGLPMRFLVPPRLDVLDIRYEQCRDRSTATL